ncbi:MAG: hypothetical protein K1W23_01500 [Lachnospiraceae bacterium]
MEVYYHGTDNNSAYNILTKGFMKPSIGDNHWLGDGYYFYRNEEYAFRWILMKYTNNFKNQYAADYGNIFGEYTILAAQMKENIRVFSMQDIKNRLYFIKVKNKLKEVAEYSDSFRKQVKSKGIVDGVVFNVMFEDMGLDKDYDAIEADFTITFVQEDSRLDYLPEDQLCVRRLDVIDTIQKFNGEEVPDNYKIFINEYNQSKAILNQKNRESKVNKARMYKKHFRADNKYGLGGKSNDRFERQV